MRIYLSLLLLAIGGVALIVLPVPLLHLRAIEPMGLLKWWQGTLEAFAVPLSLLLLNFTRHIWVRLSSLFWGLWIAVLSAWMIVQSKEVVPDATFNGVLFLLAVMIASIALVIFSALTFYHPPEGSPSEEKIAPVQNAPPDSSSN